MTTVWSVAHEEKEKKQRDLKKENNDLDQGGSGVAKKKK